MQLEYIPCAMVAACDAAEDMVVKRRRREGTLNEDFAGRGKYGIQLKRIAIEYRNL